MKIISWNVNGLRAVDRKGSFEHLLYEAKPDILCIQETKALPNQLSDSLRSPPGYHSFFHFPTLKKGYSGVAIYTKEEPARVELDLGIREMDQEGRLILAEFAGFTLINCYFPNGGGAPERLEYKMAFYSHFLDYIERLKQSDPQIVFCGDVNVAHTAIDLARPKENANHIGFLPEERAWMDRLIEHGWVDVYRHFYPDRTGAYTYWDMKSFARERNVGWRIDYFFTTPEMLERVRSVHILDGIHGSDHCPVELVLRDN